MSVALSPAAAGTELADLDERSLVQRAVARDADAFGVLYARNRDMVHRILNSLLRDFPSDVDDVASQVFLAAFEQIPNYEDRGRPFAAWLCSILHYHAMAQRNWRLSRREDELAAPSSAGPDVMAQRGLSTEDEAILRLELRRLLNSLTARRRLALVMRDWAGWSYDEIARALNLSHRNVDATVNLARKAVREAARSEQPLTDRSVCECGCGQPIADSGANGSRRFASQECWERATKERCVASRPAAPKSPRATAERVLARITAAGNDGIARGVLVQRSGIPAAQLAVIVEELVRQRLISVTEEPAYRRTVTIYRATADAAAGRAA